MNRNAEASILSSCMFSELAVTKSIEKLTPEDFTVKNHRNIFIAVSELFKNSESIDILTIMDKMTSLGIKYDVSFVNELSDITLSDSSIEDHIKMVKRNTLKLSAKKITSEVNNKIGSDEDINKVIDYAREKFMNIDTTEDKHDFTPAEAVSKTLKHTQETIASGKPVGLRTYIPELDEYMIMKKGDLIIIGALTGAGKTMLANQIGFENVMHGMKLAEFNMEMETEDLINREIARQSGISLSDINLGRNIDIGKYSDYAEVISQQKFHIDDDGEQTVAKIHSRLIRYRNQMGGLDLVIVDYYQLIQGGEGDSRQQKLGDISRRLKVLAKHFQVPVILLSQLNEAYHTREAKDIQQDADKIIKLFRPAYDNYGTHLKDGALKVFRDNEWIIPEPNFVIIKLEKHRGGETAKIRLSFDGKHQRFYSWEQDCVNI